MADVRASFSLSDAKRIARVVREVEGGRGGQAMPRLPVRLPTLVSKLCKLNEPLEAGDVAEATVWLSTSTSAAPAETTKTINVWDWMLASGYRLPADTKCIAVRVPAVRPRWYVVAAAECPTTEST